MNARSHAPGIGFCRVGFSLVEVVLAIGIVSFALLAVLGIFGGIMKSSDDNTQRREMAEAVDSLRRELKQADFATAYGWVRDGKTLFYLTYFSDTNGNPDPASSIVVGRWFEQAQLTNTAGYEGARSGRWIRAKLAVSPSNPGGVILSSDPAAYERASVLALVKMDAVSTPSQSATNSGILETTLPLMR